MQKPLFKRIRWWLTVAGILYVIIGILIYFLQEKILFQPQPLPFDHKYDFPGPYQEVNLPVNENRNLGIVQFTTPDSVCKGVVLYFHGNKRNIERYASFAPYFTRNNYDVWMIDYPGFGKSTGERTEKTLYSDALELYKMAKARFGEDSIVLYGKSLGSGIAAQLASVRNCRRLILETPYYDFPSVIRRFLPIYPVKWMLHYQIPTHEYLEKIRAPVSIFQGTNDRIVTHSNAKRLQPLLKDKDEFVSLPGGSHNDLYEFDETVRKLDSLLAI